jgi:uncharacterized protein (DUF1778 family)
MRITPEQKTERIDLRTTENVKRLLQQAAIASHKNVSEFLLEHGLSAAERTLANRKLFTLDDKKWSEFQKALDRSPQKKPALRKLLTEPGAFD